MSTSPIQLIQDDPWLEPYEADLKQRQHYFRETLEDILSNNQSLYDFASGHCYFGFTWDDKTGDCTYREWAPAAKALFLVGDFNEWEVGAHPLTPKNGGVWEIIIPAKNAPKHESLVKVVVRSEQGDRYRIPAYITRTLQDEDTKEFAGQIWRPKKAYAWKDKKFELKAVNAPLIYECHIGMAQEKEGVGTYREFADEVLPRIKNLGYNCLQIMAIKEHPYYGSFGYHVANYFATSSRFGTPEDFKYLVDKAHQAGIAVIMDMVHSHAVKNEAEGLNNFDGSENQYFHKGGRGYHDLWDSKLFDYGRDEVIHFLLSNLRYWLEEFHIDGFRFDGVTSMLYHHHGNMVSFDHYDKYFKEGVDWDAVRYLQLANKLIKEVNADAISIAEDMSGMPGLCRTIADGGIGFDYRLAMGLPDYWIKLLKHQQDEEWSMEQLWNVLSNKRYKEKSIAYAESHDQAMVGDKTLAFWLMDKEMYWHMQKADTNLIIDRGIALHKMIRLISAAAGGEGYLNFIGNEFGHPEWIDFPREGNDWSYKYARRQWSLVDHPELKYQYLNEFDRQMIHLLKAHDVLSDPTAQLLNVDEANKSLMFSRKGLVFSFNFHPSNAIFDYRFFVPEAGSYELLLCSDDAAVGGHGRIDPSVKYATQEDEHGTPFLSIYNTNRTAFVFRKK
ncbi:MAG: alpha amylase C-terminal domain-containing protein [Cyclobacteriaceae bacterium]|nr:alpha amylase C-terminal domain-containing protein [Cyclobacteriaceae bacterium]MCH8517294.1 alpha amylase C-terminal domain-containing protein [Cyclobacteriaceae bacterium]